MKQETIPNPPLAAKTLIHGAYEGLAPFVSTMDRVMQVLAHLDEVGDGAASSSIRTLRRTIRAFEPSVTMIGQVKAGKTSLVNAMIGRPGLLPADINPWTSVVTSLHVAPGTRPDGQKAKFSFFSEEEWSNLLNKGGRVGELASRAGADKELDKVRAQLQEMREKSKARLGAKFEMLLGQTHDYGYVDEDLIQRYVCLGDDLSEGDGVDPGQGRFADITKSADLFIGQNALPLPLCIRDTPGVNDTFMVREQITVNAIRASKLCVVVLSAHQALSTVDMALIRLISNIRARKVILFVNRIDELSNPAEAIPEIRESIRATLTAHKGPADADIIFGSAHWANRALAGDLHGLGKSSADALISLAEDALRNGVDHDKAEDMVWDLSGLPALGRAIAERVLDGEGQLFANDAITHTRNIAGNLAAAHHVLDAKAQNGATLTVPPDEIAQKIDAIAETAGTALRHQFDALIESLDIRLDRSRSTFLSRATASLISHLEVYGDEAVWTYDPSGLRVLLRSGYQVFAGKAERAAKTVLQETADALHRLQKEAFQLPEEALDLTAPGVPEPPVPVMLGQTIALDIKGNWWTRWWRKRRSYAAFADEFSSLIDAEIAPMVDALSRDHATVYRQMAEEILHDFINAQRRSFVELAGQTEDTLDALRQRLTQNAEAKTKHLGIAQTMLSALSYDQTAAVQQEIQ